MTVGLYRLAASVAPRLPRWLRPLVPRLLAPIAWMAAGEARRRASANVVHVLGPASAATAAGRRRIRKIVRGVFFHSLSNYLDLFAMPTSGPRMQADDLDVSGEEHVREALALGKGVILFSAHFGPFHSLCSFFPLRGCELVIPVEKLRDEEMFAITNALRNQIGVRFVPVGLEALGAMVANLRRNQLVLITADRAIEGPSALKEFFGAPARLPTGPAQLSARTGAPLVGAFGWRSPNRRTTCEFTPLTLALPEHQRLDASILEQKIVARLEEVIGAHPEQWLVFDKVWAEPWAA